MTDNLNPRRPLWAIRGSLDRRIHWLIACSGLLLALLAWWLASTGGAIDPVFLPTPPLVLNSAWEWLHDGDLFGDVAISVYRVMAGFLLSAVLALPLGVLVGTYAPVKALFEPLTDFIRYMPAAAFIPLVMLWVGIDEGAKIAIIFIGTFFQMLLMIAEDVRRVPMEQIEAAQTMGADRDEIVMRVIMPSAKPAILDTLRVTIGWAWTYLVVAELVAANSGLGFAVLKAQRFLQTDKIFAGIILIGLFGLATDQCFRWAHRRSFPWLYRR
ncbi:ABC transporter permease [Methylomonas sp. HW2-6]|uniref:ABC transporter permease n=1 Tax=Methylomonas sp. HW2-6 TaxID=3376687 RepID=UPI004041C4F1